MAVTKVKAITEEEFQALPDAEKEEILINTRLQQVFDLIKAARIPVDLFLVAALAQASERLGKAVVEQMTPEEREVLQQQVNEVAKAKELYLAHNMADAARGGSHKLIISG